MRWEIAQGLLPTHVADELLRRYDLYLKGEISEVDMCGEMVTCHAGLRLAEITAATSRFAEKHILPNIFPVMLEVVERLRAQGCDIWAVSSTYDLVVREGLAPFGIFGNRVLGAEIAYHDGIATCELLAVPTDEFKAAALVRAGIPHPDVVFGNSMHDVAMLEIARDAYAINPNDDLRAVAEARGWAVYQPLALVRTA